MIYSLTGSVVLKKNGWVEVLVGGVGYKVLVSDSTGTKLSLEEDNKMFIHHHFTQDAQSLFGFLNESDLELFEKMLSVNGVGPKTGLIIMDKGAGAVLKAIATADLKFFESIKGIGKKTAQRILVDLKGVLVQRESEVEHESLEAYADLTQALSQLGYTSKEISMVIKKMPVEIEDISAQLQWGLRNIK